METVPVEVTDGKIKVTFTPKVENPQICAIEIIPQSGGETSAVTPAPAAAVPSAPADPTPAPAAPTGPTVLQIDAGKVTGKVSPMLYGLMTEEINFAYEGGLYGELIRNRSFKADAVVPRVTPETYEVGKYLPVTFKPDTQPRFWTVVGGASMVLDTDHPSERIPERQPQARRFVSLRSFSGGRCQRRILGYSRQAKDHL